MELQFRKYTVCLEIFLRNEDRLSHDFNVVGSSLQMLGVATEKACLPILYLVLGTESCSDVDDQSYLEMFHRCRRLDKRDG